MRYANTGVGGSVEGSTVGVPFTFNELRDATFERQGDDLKISTEDQSAVLKDYFLDPRDLTGTDGASLGADFVRDFAFHAEAYASLGGVSGSLAASVEGLSGEAWVRGVDGRIVELSEGSLISERSEVFTGKGSRLELLLADGSKMQLGSEARIALEEFDFDGGDSSGSLLVSALKGLFAFASGLIGKENPQNVVLRTPTAEIGLRGTKVIAEVDEAGESKIGLLEGAIQVATGGGLKTVDVPFSFVNVISSSEAPSDPKTFDPRGGVFDMGDLFGAGGLDAFLNSAPPEAHNFGGGTSAAAVGEYLPRADDLPEITDGIVVDSDAEDMSISSDLSLQSLLGMIKSTDTPSTEEIARTYGGYDGPVDADADGPDITPPPPPPSPPEPDPDKYLETLQTALNDLVSKLDTVDATMTASIGTDLWDSFKTNWLDAAKTLKTALDDDSTDHEAKAAQAKGFYEQYDPNMFYSLMYDHPGLEPEIAKVLAEDAFTDLALAAGRYTHEMDVRLDPNAWKADPADGYRALTDEAAVYAAANAIYERLGGDPTSHANNNTFPALDNFKNNIKALLVNMQPVTDFDAGAFKGAYVTALDGSLVSSASAYEEMDDKIVNSGNPSADFFVACLAVIGIDYDPAENKPYRFSINDAQVDDIAALIAEIQATGGTVSALSLDEFTAPAIDFGRLDEDDGYSVAVGYHDAAAVRATEEGSNT